MMMQQVVKKRFPIIIISTILSVFLTLTFGTLLACASQSLPDGIVIGDEAGVSATSEGEYFVDLPNILPGEIYEKTITIRSLDVKEPFELGMLVTTKSEEGSIDFNKHIILTLTLGEKELYKGPLLGNDEFDWKVQPLVIGTCKYGTDQILIARFEVDNSLTNEDYKEASQLIYHWTFVATKNLPKPTDNSLIKTVEEKKTGKLPMTGEEIRNLIYKILTGLLLVLIAILLLKKRKEEQKVE